MPAVNTHYMEQARHFKGLHRSGWEYVLTILETINNDASGIWCDTFVDRTFLFSSDPEVHAIIPYTVPWIGFVHHPFDRTNSSSDSHLLARNEKFQASLKFCKGLFVFGSQMQTQWARTLYDLGSGDVPVHSVIHPTQSASPDALFTMDKLDKNPEPAIVQVGAHLRDTYAIFALNNGNSPVGEAGLHKTALVGPAMSAYYVAEDFFSYLVYQENLPREGPIPKTPVPLNQEVVLSVNANVPNVLWKSVSTEPSSAVTAAICRAGLACRDSFNNKYVLGALKLLKKYDLSVALMPTLDNDSYDKLLSRNIVFLQLLPSATTGINTILECIVRNTPVVVNRTSATLELLGSNYPLFFDTIDQVPQMLNRATLAAAHQYISSMDKTPFSPKVFIDTVEQLIA